MNRLFAGTSPLAIIADTLPVRGRIGIVVMMGALALERLESAPDFPVAQAAFDLCRRWFDGERFDSDRFDEAYYDEFGYGLAQAANNARSKSELATWAVLASAMKYVELHASWIESH